MARIDVVIDTKVFERRLTKLEREQLPFANSLAANQAAFETMGVMRRVAPLIVQEPTPFTIAAIRYRKGNKQSPVAEVYLSGEAVKGTPPAKYLTITRGGARGQRRSERVLTRAGLIEASEGWVPGKWLKPNRYGNRISGARMTQVLSAISAFGESGFSANATARSRSRNPGRSEYFFYRGGASGLPRGIYERYGAAGKAKDKYKELPAGRSLKRRNIRPVLLVVPLPTYGKPFDFVGLAVSEARRRFIAAWPAAMRRALATAR